MPYRPRSSTLTNVDEALSLSTLTAMQGSTEHVPGQQHLVSNKTAAASPARKRGRRSQQHQQHHHHQWRDHKGPVAAVKHFDSCSTMASTVSKLSRAASDSDSECEVDSSCSSDVDSEAGAAAVESEVDAFLRYAGEQGADDESVCGIAGSCIFQLDSPLTVVSLGDAAAAGSATTQPQTEGSPTATSTATDSIDKLVLTTYRTEASQSPSSSASPASTHRRERRFRRNAVHAVTDEELEELAASFAVLSEATGEPSHQLLQKQRTLIATKRAIMAGDAASSPAAAAGMSPPHSCRSAVSSGASSWSSWSCGTVDEDESDSAAADRRAVAGSKTVTTPCGFRKDVVRVPAVLRTARSVPVIATARTPRNSACSTTSSGSGSSSDGDLTVDDLLAELSDAFGGDVLACSNSKSNSKSSSNSMHRSMPQPASSRSSQSAAAELPSSSQLVWGAAAVEVPRLGQVMPAPTPVELQAPRRSPGRAPLHPGGGVSTTPKSVTAAAGARVMGGGMRRCTSTASLTSVGSTCSVVTSGSPSGRRTYNQGRRNAATHIAPLSLQDVTAGTPRPEAHGTVLRRCSSSHALLYAYDVTMGATPRPGAHQLLHH